MPGGGAGLGIDFGTSNTVAVLRPADGRRQSLLFDGSPMLPSAVYAESADTLLTGRDALYSARLDPARFEPNPKRRIDEGLVLLGEAELPATTLVAAVLERVAAEASRTVGYALDDVVVTYPAGWGASRRLLLADAAEHAGLGGVRLVPEPVAAAMYFVRVLGQDVPVGSGVLVHDFGAGTFDASVVLRTETGFETVAVDGRDDTGGLDVDAAIVEHLREVYAGADWNAIRSPRTTADRRARRTLWEDVRLAKERLSRHSSAGIVLPGLDDDAVLTRDELDALAKPLIDRTVRMTQSVLRFSRLPDERVAGVFLVGGGSRMPLVSTMLHRALGIAPTVLEQPELVVAEGALAEAPAPVPAPVAPAAARTVVVAVPAGPPAQAPTSAAPAPLVEGRARVTPTPPKPVSESSAAETEPEPVPVAPPQPATVPRSPQEQARRRIRLVHLVLWPVAAVAILGTNLIAKAAAGRQTVWGGEVAFLVAIMGAAVVAGIVAAVMLRPTRRRILVATLIVLAAATADVVFTRSDAVQYGTMPSWVFPLETAALGVALALCWLLIRGRSAARLWVAAFAALPLGILHANGSAQLLMWGRGWFWLASTGTFAAIAVAGWIARIPWNQQAPRG